MKTKSALRSLLTIAGSSLLAISYSHADQIWDGTSAVDSNWNTAANWGSDILPTFTSAITFTGNTRNAAANNITGDPTIGGINFTNDGSAGFTNAFTLSTNRITLGGDITTTANTTGSTITDTISLAMILNGNRIITTNQLSSTVQHNLTISGLISGTGGLTKSGDGTLILNNTASSFSGNINITGGTLQTGAGINTNNITTGSLGNPQTLNRTITVGSGAILKFAGGAVFGGGGSSVKAKLIANGGTITNTSGSYSTLGPVELNGGTIHSTGGQQAGYPSFQLSGTITVGGSTVSTMSSNGASLSEMTLSGGGARDTTATFHVNDAVTGSASDLNVSVPLQNAWGHNGLTKTGAGTMTLSATNTYSGTTTVSAGILRISSTGTINGTTFAFSTGTSAGAVSIGAGEFNYNSSTALTKNVTFSGTGGTLSGTGTINTAVTIPLGNTLSPGNSAGTMTYANTLGLAGNTFMEIDGNAGAGVTNGHDFVNLTGAGAAGVLTCGGAMTLDIGFIFGSGSYTFNLFDFASEAGTFSTVSLADQYSGSFTNDGFGVWSASTNAGNEIWQFTESTGVLGLTVIPEPRAALLGTIGILALLRRRRA